MRLLSSFRWLGGLAAALSLVACTTLAPALTPTPAKPLRVAHDFWPGYYPLFIAREKGYFAEAGVAVDNFTPEDTDSILISFAKGEYDGLAVGLGDVINLTQNNPDIVVIFSTDESSGADVAMTLDPTIQSVADLKGRRVGTNLGGFGEVFVNQVLLDNGLRPDEVSWVNMDAAKALENLQSGTVDVAHTWEPYATEAEQQGARRLFSTADTPGLVPSVMVFQGKTVRERPTEVRAFVQAWFKAVAFWQANPAEGSALIAQALQKPLEFVSLEGIKLRNLEENRQFFTVGPDSIYDVTNMYVEFFVKNGSLSARPDAAKLLDGEFLK